MAKKGKKYKFTYTFSGEPGMTPKEVLEQELYDIVANNDKISEFGVIEEVK